MASNVVFDFDGVINSYVSGWVAPDVVNDPPVPGIAEAIRDIRNAGYRVVIVSSRCAYKGGKKAIQDYLDKNQIVVDEITDIKPAAKVYIDDRALRFDGHPETLLEQIDHFNPWWK